MKLGLLFAGALLLSGCASQSRGARAQEAATELNLNARFGRMEMAAERVSQSARGGFYERRKKWGGAIRVADAELAGLRFVKNEEEAVVLVKVSWFKVDEGELHMTTVRQDYKDEKGEFRLIAETRQDGDIGLLGEAAPPAPKQEGGPRSVQFPTIRLGQTAPTGTD